MFSLEIDEHITIKLLAVRNAEELYKLTDGSRDQLREWLAWVDTTKSSDDSSAFIEHTIQSFKENKSLTTGIFFKDELAGTAGFNSFDWINKIGYIGYWLAPLYQGQGIMTRVTQTLTDYAFNELNLNRVDIRAAYENKKSRAIPERLGFVKEGQIRQAEWLYDHYVDHVVYGMLESEWKKQ
ncbi:GNAT family protein [Virgibacillus sp. C22-A2]|uniref:GNAT family protein n=1 Tax=Virgibacillus tibetensis TaxID=3042313 RepID=A0ABU6KJS7_9BACI|nr:GNAT family protein [Virgibacillus sp. C22-A2]